MKVLYKVFDTRTAMGPIVFMMLPVLFYGVGFTFFNHTGPVETSVLHKTMSEGIGSFYTYIWGAIMVGVIVAMITLTFVRERFLAKATCFVAFLAWCFAGMIYLQAGNWLLLGGIMAPNVLLWGWLYQRFAQNNSDIRLKTKRKK